MPKRSLAGLGFFFASIILMGPFAAKAGDAVDDALPAALTEDLQATPEPRVGETFSDCRGCPQLVVVPAGQFLMGSPSSEPERRGAEGPQHRVTISEAFAVGVYEVTWDEWELCVSEGGCSNAGPDSSGGDEGWGKGDRPVANISWKDAQAFVLWLSRKTGKTYRLLSEAEWEYVARSGTETPFSTGDRITSDQANFDGRHPYNGSGEGVYRGEPTPVGEFQPNAFGVYDFHGNVWEWVQDCWNESYAGAPPDGRPWESGFCSRRVLRGGSRVDQPWYLRSAFRFGEDSTFRTNVNGFRIARMLD